jgi:hypothetical protein
VNAEEREQLVQESDRYRRQLEENAARVRTIKMNEQKVAEEIATVQRNKVCLERDDGYDKTKSID